MYTYVHTHIYACIHTDVRIYVPAPGRCPFSANISSSSTTSFVSFFCSNGRHSRKLARLDFFYMKSSIRSDFSEGLLAAPRSRSSIHVFFLSFVVIVIDSGVAAAWISRKLAWWCFYRVNWVTRRLLRFFWLLRAGICYIYIYTCIYVKYRCIYIYMCIHI